MDAKKEQAPVNKTHQMFRRLVWLYIVLLLIEGSLRKWVLPQLSDVLLLARDPIVLFSYFLAIRHKIFPFNLYVVSAWGLMLLCFVLALLFAHGNFIVAAYGFKGNVLHIPFAFIIGKVLNRNDVVILGKWWLWATLGMTVLICMQFYSPQSAWVNMGVGGDTGGAGFGGALGRFRPPGTFSFIIGVTWFYVFSTAFLICGLTMHKGYSKWLLIASAMAIIVAMPVSISRMMVLASALTLIIGIISSSRQKNALLRYGRFALFIIVGVLLASSMPVFDDARDAFLSRWTSSTEDFKSSIIDRTLGDFMRPFVSDRDIPIFGFGLGAGTQVGLQLLSGARSFALGESDWERIVCELGKMFGILFLLWRVALTIGLGRSAMRAFRNGNGMGLIFLSATAYNLLVGPLGQVTVSGFVVIGIGLTIASMGIPKTKTKAKTIDAATTT